MRLSLTEILGTRNTARWHTRLHARVQTVAEHHAVTALLALWLAGEEVTDRERADILHLSLVHDAHEPVYGDPPYPAKQALMAAGVDLDRICAPAFWGSRGLPQLKVSDRVQDLVDAADGLDNALYARDWLPAIFPECAAQATQRAACLPPEAQDKVRFALYNTSSRQVVA